MQPHTGQTFGISESLLPPPDHDRKWREVPAKWEGGGNDALLKSSFTHFLLPPPNFAFLLDSHCFAATVCVLFSLLLGLGLGGVEAGDAVLREGQQDPNT